MNGSKERRTASTIVVLQTHYLNRSLVNFFRTLQDAVPGRDACLLMHLPPDAPVPSIPAAIPHHLVTTPEIRNPDYVIKSGGPDWRIWRGGHTDLIALQFFSTRREYEHYWFIEYDVRFSGNWRDFFSHFEGTNSDFLSTTIRRASTDQRWMHWPSLHVPDSAGKLTDRDRICSFMPIFRISRRGLEAVDRAYRAGWSGHCEVTWPTILNHAGLTLEDIGGAGEFVADENRNRFYANTPLDADLAPGSMVFRPARMFPGWRRNWLWHPIKPVHYKLREDARHAWVLMKPFVMWVSSLVTRRYSAPKSRHSRHG